MHSQHKVLNMSQPMIRRRLEVFVNDWVNQWSSLRVDMKVRVNIIVDPIYVMVIVYAGSEDNILCKCEFYIDSEFKYRCFKRAMDGLLLAYCRSVTENTS